MGRGARGESTIVRGSDGRWHGYVSMGLKTGGDRDRRHVAAVKRADVVAAVRRLEEQRDAGVVLAGGRTVTVEQWMALWLNSDRQPEDPSEHRRRLPLVSQADLAAPRTPPA